MLNAAPPDKPRVPRSVSAPCRHLKS
jgi:hypothetical protein